LSYFKTQLLNKQSNQIRTKKILSLKTFHHVLCPGLVQLVG
jgi:hypothetical protein